MKSIGQFLLSVAHLSGYSKLLSDCVKIKHIWKQILRRWRYITLPRSKNVKMVWIFKEINCKNATKLWKFKKNRWTRPNFESVKTKNLRYIHLKMRSNQASASQPYKWCVKIPVLIQTSTIVSLYICRYVSKWM